MKIILLVFHVSRAFLVQFPAVLICGLVIASHAAHALAECSSVDQIAPNPNPVGSTISNTSPTGCNALNPFNNYGTLNNNIGATLYNNGPPFSNTVLNNYGTLNNDGVLYNHERALVNYGTLNNNDKGTLQSDGSLQNYGTLNNDGTLGNANSMSNLGTLTNNGSMTSAGGAMSNTGTLINNGSFYTGGNTGIGNGPSGTWTNNGSITIGGMSSAGYLFNEGQFTNFGSVISTGSGTQLNPEGIRQVAGTLRNDGSITQQRLNISGGVLQGTGNITGLVTVNGGTISPGNSAGTLTIDGGMSFNSGTLLTEIGGTGAGQFDLLKITGTASFLSGTLEFDFFNDFTPHIGDKWTFLTADGGIRGWEAMDVVVSGRDVGYRFFITATGNDGLTLHVAAAPEPEIYAMMAIGIGVLGIVGRRRREQIRRGSSRPPTYPGRGQ